MKTKIDQIWNELTEDDSFLSGLLVRRYSASLSPDVFAALRGPEKRRCLACLVDNANLPSGLADGDFRDMCIEVLSETTHPGKSYLLVVLANNDLKDIFSILCEDLISSMSAENDEKKLIAELLNRLEKWRSLLEKATLPGLTGEEQRGLFGELCLLNKMLERLPDNSACVLAWTGATGQPQDFQGVNWAVEVKTCHSGNHHKIQINGIRQLDTRGLDFLALHQIIIAKSNSEGASLNTMVDNVARHLEAEFSLLTRFRSLLAEAGYFDHQRDLYDEPQYVVRQETSFEVKEEFPRIQPDEIRNGVGDLRYTVNVADCLTWRIPEEKLFNKIAGT